MINLSIDTLYLNLNKHIKLIESYSEIKNLSKLIKMCRLKPRALLNNTLSKKVELHREWFDEFGNSFTLKKKKVIIKYNDLSINKSEIVSTDLYYGLSIKDLLKISKLAFCIYGKDDFLNEECCIITFLGIDNYLRSYVFIYNEWIKVSPLMFGMNNIHYLINNENIKHFHEFLKNKDAQIPCVTTRAWISYLPPSQELLGLVKNECNYIIPILT